MQHSIKIGNSSGFWGDVPDALYAMLQKSDVHYITSDYLAEVSMSILRKQQRKNADLGYVQDFLRHFSKSASLLSQKKVKLLTNAGGNNPRALAFEIQKEAKRQGLDFKIVVVEGDNVLDLVQNTPLADLHYFEQGAKVVTADFLSANAYIGVSGLVKALELDAQIVIAGRVTDSALALAPMIYEFGWNLDDYDKLAAGMLAAHCIECGSQVVGGNFTDWESVENWLDFGFPIVEMQENATFLVTKPENTGGLVSVNTVKEQLVYEIADPKNYYSPDVIADLTALKVSSIGGNKVLVSDAKGKAPTRFYKVSASYHNGYRAVGEIMLSGAKALEKAKLLEKIFWTRLSCDFERKNTEFIGYNACHGAMAKQIEPNEILLRFYAHDWDKEKLECFTENVASLILSGPQGLAVTGGRPRIQEVFAYCPLLIDKSKLTITVFDLDTSQEHEVESKFSFTETVEESDCLSSMSDEIVLSVLGEYKPLSAVCLARSGDKGDCVNIGVIARSKKAFDFLQKHLTPSLLKQWYGDRVKGTIRRYELPEMQAFNFYLEKALDGGGTNALRIDAQGKTFAAALLAQEMKIPNECLI